MFGTSMFRKGGNTDKAIPSSAAELKKLKDYHQLMEDTMAAAHKAQMAGDVSRAVGHYRLAQQVADESRSVKPPYDKVTAANVNIWRESIDKMRRLVGERLTSDMSRRPIPKSAVSQQPHHQRPTTTVPKATPPAPSSVPPASAHVNTSERTAIEAEILTEKPAVAWGDIVGLTHAKTMLEEAVILPSLRADLFRGLRAPARGILLYGPPGNGKTMLAQAVAARTSATFFAISASSLTSKWHGEGEKLVRALFALAREKQPSLIFIDEIDSILGSRSTGEHDASRRLKTEFLVQFDGVASSNDKTIVLAATNRPEELDDAVRRRLTKRVYVALPDKAARIYMLKLLLKQVKHSLQEKDAAYIAERAEGYSGSDLKALSMEAAMMPLRDLGPRITTIKEDKLRRVDLSDFEAAFGVIKASVSPSQIQHFIDWTREYGTAA